LNLKRNSYMNKSKIVLILNTFHSFFIFVAFFILIYSIFTFPSNWFLLTVSEFIGIDQTKVFYTFLFIIVGIFSTAYFIFIYNSINHKFTKLIKRVVFLPAIFTILYSIFNVTNYEILHYIFVTCAVFSFFIFQILISYPPLNTNKMLLNITSILIALKISLIAISFILFKTLVIPFEILILLIIIIWMIFVLKPIVIQNIKSS
jgi:hypothetical protein